MTPLVDFLNAPLTQAKAKKTPRILLLRIAAEPRNRLGA
jgi:hypothetical protein